jgi:hypothetical protein
MRQYAQRKAHTMTRINKN